MSETELLTPDDVAHLLGCSAATVRRRTCAGELPGVKFGRDWRYPKQALLDAIDALARKRPVASVPQQQPNKRRLRVLPVLPELRR